MEEILPLINIFTAIKFLLFSLCAVGEGLASPADKRL